ncbi:hypothetical protein KC330_g176 [Hortaea werneckii]|nr:hypothetical protein KC330_g176 [Hortaea werneckii]
MLSCLAAAVGIVGAVVACRTRWSSWTQAQRRSFSRAPCYRYCTSGSAPAHGRTKASTYPPITYIVHSALHKGLPPALDRLAASAESLHKKQSPWGPGYPPFDTRPAGTSFSSLWASLENGYARKRSHADPVCADRQADIYICVKAPNKECSRRERLVADETVRPARLYISLVSNLANYGLKLLPLASIHTGAAATREGPAHHAETFRPLAGTYQEPLTFAVLLLKASASLILGISL